MYTLSLTGKHQIINFLMLQELMFGYIAKTYFNVLKIFLILNKYNLIGF